LMFRASTAKAPSSVEGLRAKALADHEIAC
jgi:hypothetical protein